MGGSGTLKPFWSGAGLVSLQDPYNTTNAMPVCYQSEHNASPLLKIPAINPTPCFIFMFLNTLFLCPADRIGCYLMIFERFRCTHTPGKRSKIASCGNRDGGLQNFSSLIYK
jgi:hypothetical protein